MIRPPKGMAILRCTDLGICFESENRNVLGLFIKLLTELLDGVIEQFSVSDDGRPVGVLKNARFLNTFTKRAAWVRPAG